MTSSFGVEAVEDDRRSVQPAANQKSAAKAEASAAAARAERVEDERCPH